MHIAQLIEYFSQFDGNDVVMRMKDVQDKGGNADLLLKFGLTDVNNRVEIIGGVAGLNLLVLKNPDIETHAKP